MLISCTPSKGKTRSYEYITIEFHAQNKDSKVQKRIDQELAKFDNPIVDFMKETHNLNEISTKRILQTIPKDKPKEELNENLEGAHIYINSLKDADKELNEEKIIKSFIKNNWKPKSKIQKPQNKPFPKPISLEEKRKIKEENNNLTELKENKMLQIRFLLYMASKKRERELYLALQKDFNQALTGASEFRISQHIKSFFKVEKYNSKLE